MKTGWNNCVRGGVIAAGLLAAWAAPARLTSALAQSPTTSTSEPAESRWLRTHEEFVAAAREYPPFKGIYISVETAEPLNDRQMKTVERIEELLAEARSECEAGKFANARSKATEAMASARKLLGPANFLSISATGARRLYGQYVDATPDKQKMLMEGDKARAAALAAYRLTDYDTAETEAKRAIDLRRRALGDQFDELVDVDALRICAMAQTEGGRIEQAEQTFQRTLAVLERSFGKKHPKYAETLTRLGWLRILQNRYKDALELLRNAMVIHNSTHGETIDTARTLDHLGTALLYVGDPEGAIRDKVRSLVIREALTGADSTETAESYSNLAWLYHGIGFHESVVPLRKKALAIFEKEYGLKHRYTITELSNLARTHEDHEEFGEAIKLYEKYLDRQNETTLLDEYRWNARLGAAYLMVGRKQDAQRMFEKVLKDLEATQNPASSRSALVNVLSAVRVHIRLHQGQDAGDLLQRSLKILKSKDPKATERDILPIEDLGVLYGLLGRYEEALGYLREAADAARKSKSDFAKQELLTYLTSQVHLLLWLKDYRAAEEVCDEAVRLTDVPGIQGTPTNALALILSAKVQTENDQLDRASFYLDEARRILDSLTVTNSPVHINYLIARGTLLHVMKKDEEGRKLLKEAVDRTREPYAKHGQAEVELLLMRAMKSLLDASGGPSGAPAVADELKKLLDKRRRDGSLVAETRDWPKELGL